MKPAAVLLAGGLARRMGGGDKPLRLLGGRPILAHAIARVAPQVSALAVNAFGDPARFAEWGLPVIPDVILGTPGPLAGIHAGMAWARAAYPDISQIVSIPADLPFLPDQLVARLLAARAAEGADIAVASSGGRRHPPVALWPAGLADALYHAVSDGLRRVTEFQRRYRVAYADFPIGDIDPFTNINTQHDLDQAQLLIEAVLPNAPTGRAAPGT